MYLNFKEKCSDCDGQAIDIFASNEGEYFLLGRIFERIYATGNIAWCFDHGIRIPLQRAPQDDEKEKQASAQQEQP